MDDFYVTAGPASPAAAVPVARPVARPPARPARRSSKKLRRWPVIVAALALLAVVVALVFLAWPSSSPGRPDPTTARTFGHAARAELPAPVTLDECASALQAFPAIAHDTAARAAFLSGCTSSG